MTDQMSHL